MPDADRNSAHSIDDSAAPHAQRAVSGVGDASLPPTGAPALVLVRHGETEWSRTGRHTGRTDVTLTPTGVEQARSAGAMLRRVLAAGSPKLVVSSPRARALETAELAGYHVDVVTEDAAEWDYGDYEGLTSAEIHRDDPDWTIWRGPVPNGETDLQITARLDRLLAMIADRAPGGPVVVFSHGHASRSLAARWLAQPVQAGAAYWLGTGAVSVLGYEHRHRAILHWNLDKSVAGAAG